MVITPKKLTAAGCWLLVEPRLSRNIMALSKNDVSPKLVVSLLTMAVIGWLGGTTIDGQTFLSNWWLLQGRSRQQSHLVRSHLACVDPALRMSSMFSVIRVVAGRCLLAANINQLINQLMNYLMIQLINHHNQLINELNDGKLTPSLWCSGGTTANGTCLTSFRNRLDMVDPWVNKLINGWESWGKATIIGSIITNYIWQAGSITTDGWMNIPTNG